MCLVNLHHIPDLNISKIRKIRLGSIKFITNILLAKTKWELD